MHAQFIKSESGDELVVIPRRDYDAMLARLGDENAEDRVTERLVAESRARIAAGAEGLIAAGADGRPPRPSPLGQRIRDARKAKGMTQMQLAESAGITQGYLSDVEVGRKSPTSDVVDQICQALGVEQSRL